MAEKKLNGTVIEQRALHRYVTMTVPFSFCSAIVVWIYFDYTFIMLS